MLIGDQLYTDVWSGNFAGVDTILVKPQARRTCGIRRSSVSLSAGPCATFPARNRFRHVPAHQTRLRPYLLYRLFGRGQIDARAHVGTMFKRRFIDTDRLVVRRCGKSVTEIFETEGEDRFRELETSALRSLQSERSLLVSCGGGIVETPVNIELMHEMGTCVYLEGDLRIRFARFVGPTRAPISARPSMPRACLSIAVRCIARPPILPLIFATSPSRTFLPLCRDAFGAWTAMIRRQLINFQNRSVDVRVGLGAFDELSRMFASAVGKPKRAMVVWNSASSERFDEVVEHALVDAGFAVSQFSLEVSPAGATLADADAIFGALSATALPATIWLSPLAMPQPARLLAGAPTSGVAEPSARCCRRPLTPCSRSRRP